MAKTIRNEAGETIITDKNDGPDLNISREGADYLITDNGTGRIRDIRASVKDARRAAEGIRLLDRQIRSSPVFCLSYKSATGLVPTGDLHNPTTLFINPVWSEEEIEQAARHGSRAVAIVAARPCLFERSKPIPGTDNFTLYGLLVKSGQRPCERHPGLCPGKSGPVRPSSGAYSARQRRNTPEGA